MDNTIVKNVFTNHGAVSFCSACLSTDRVLSVVTEFVDLFHKICDTQTMIPPTEAILCWECIALMRKVRMFTRKVAKAQKMLQFCMSNKQAPFPRSLSKLTTTQINTDQIKLIYKEEGTKAIKLETDLDDQFVNFDNYDNFANDVKDEADHKPDPSELKVLELKIDREADALTKDDQSYRKKKELNQKRNAKRKAKYRFINTKLKKHRRYLIRNVPIEINEVLSSLEQERASSSFAEAEFKCVDCVDIFNDAEEVVKHNKQYHNASLGSFVCHICQARFPSEDALSAHGRAHRVRRECRACGLARVAAAGARRHADTHHRLVHCLACGLFYKNVRLFYDHYKLMHSRFVCDVCGKRCKSRDRIVKHLRYHFGYECPHCKKKLKNSSSYNNHIECQHTESLSDNAYCVQCDRRFKNDKLYKRHLKASSAHAKERDNTRIKRKYPCPECNKVYSRLTYMNNHYRHVHSKQSKHYCEDCDRHFLNRTRFVDHRRFKHDGAQRDKDKLCNICGRGFAANRTLINHIRTHSGERPFACEHCGAKFTQKHAMVSHVKYIHLKSRRKPSWQE